MQLAANSKNDLLKSTTSELFEVKYNALENYTGRICFFASFSYSGKADDYVYYYLNGLKKAGFAIVFITTSPLEAECIDKLKKYCSLIVERENKGLDFGSWHAALEFLQWGQPFESILLANDSVFGPFQDLEQIISSMNKRYDVWGMTDNYESGHHIQSYFLHFNKKVISSSVWLEFWKDIDITLPKNQIIQKYEVGFSDKLMKAKFKTGAYCPIDVLVKSVDEPSIVVNSSLAYWQQLIEKFNFPFLKREILINPTLNKLYWDNLSLYINQNTWRKTIRETAYPISYIDSFLENYFSILKKKNKKIKIRKSKVLFLAHNVDMGGAQKVLLNFIKWFKQHTDIPFEILIMFQGKSDDLLDDFIDVGQVTQFSSLDQAEKKYLQTRLAGEYVGLIFSNTIVNVELQKFLSFLKVPQITFVHELPYVMRHFPQVELNREWLKTNVDKFIACSEVVKRNLHEYLEVQKNNIDVLYEFVDDDGASISPSKDSNLLEDLKIPEHSFVLGLSGTFEWRKSADLLPVLANLLLHEIGDIHLIWVGADTTSALYKTISFDIEKSGLSDRVHFVSKQKDPVPYYRLFDVFLMLSREDPFPLVNIENGLMGTPVVCFEQSGGSHEYVNLGLGVSVPYMDLSRLKEAILDFYRNKLKIETDKINIRKTVKENFTTAIQAPKLLSIFSQYFDEEVLIPVLQPDITVMTHIFYDNTWVDIKRKLKQFDNGSTFFLFSISEDCLTKDEIVRDIRETFDKSLTLTTSNIGKDIGGKLALIDLYLTQGIHSEFIIFLHDKQSPQTWVGDAWKNNLHKIIDKKNYTKIIDLFMQNQDIGLIGASEHIIDEYDHVNKVFRHNNEMVNQFLEKYRINISNYEYLSGTMYWLRASIIQEFFSRHKPMALRAELESGNVLDNYGSTVAHTWERMFCWIVADQGFRIYGL